MTIVVALGMELLAENSRLLPTPLDYPKRFVLSGPARHEGTRRPPTHRRAMRVLVDRPRAKMATEGQPLLARPPFEWAATICFSLLAAAAVSWARYALSGTLRLYQDGLGTLTRVALEVAFGLCAAAAGLAYLRALRREPTPSTAATLGVAI